ncbi:hypothetical protein M2451_001673 [Dysgonomonas sp. PFB1-18]|uniref:DUF6331 family protein n=1 Tax=unclassified Dysgonomonas TaxID=2630389 RepID=UPI00247709AB|nr:MULTISPECIES: DUF6331 family protein [unclassified Dysgonomonas]MDH6309102.1 hypothetical protein [Dysgonomonas sp. PF1-14]MDH6339018.1 hypothetical protein [Dysgonomonas sp. PF1-16]MDH6380351.1 hypothetical protein [Dysgonomonas sp. PFB1-18]MDH6397846.1 hypothetical protein [Dysgonomonas sp. PF1-23]
MNKDINIGQNEWIEWIDPDLTIKPFNIDILLEPTWEFWKSMETECVAECCGIDAFYFDLRNIQKALLCVDKLELKKQIECLKEEISRSHHSVLISYKFNNLFEKSVFIQLLDHILQNIK